MFISAVTRAGQFHSVEVHYFASLQNHDFLHSLMISSLSAFPLCLKLVDSCSIGCLFFYLHFLGLILEHRANKNTAMSDCCVRGKVEIVYCD